jgi:uncharacterized membrane protein YidH (DUF202 family)
MATDANQADPPNAPWWGVLTRTNVLAGLMFMAVAVFALWVSRNYSIGTAVRMGTGYVPRLLAWVLLGLGLLILIQDLWSRTQEQAADADRVSVLRPMLFVTLSILAFALTIERFGLVIATLLLIGIGSLAGPRERPLETLIVAVAMAAAAVGIFIFGLGLTISIWPEW